MTLLRPPFTDISAQSTLHAPAVRLPASPTARTQPNRVSQLLGNRNRGFWLRVCYLIVILAIEGMAVLLLLFTIVLPKIASVNTGLAPTATSYQCVHVILIQTSPDQYITKTDYACH